MNKLTAEKIIDSMVRLNGEFNSHLIEVQTMCNEKDFNNYKRKVGKIMAYLLVDIVNPIVRQFPELKPDELSDTSE